MKIKLACLSIITFILLCIVSKYTGLRVQDGYDYAQLARNINNGKPFHSSIVIPLTTKMQNAPENVDMWRPPVFPILISMFFKIFGTQEISILLLCVLCYLMSLAAVYLLACHLYNKKTAIIATLFVGMSPELCWYTINCLREPVFALSLFVTIYLLCTQKNAYFLGGMLAITYLTRSNFLFLLPPFAIYLFIKYKQQKIGKLFLAKALCVFIVVLTPWCLRNVKQDLSPFFTLQRYELGLFTEDYPHYTVYRHIDVPDPLEYAMKNSQSIWNKAVYYSWLYYWPQTICLPAFHTQRIPRFFFEEWQKNATIPTYKFSLSQFFRIQNRQLSFHGLVFFLAGLWLVFYRNHTQKTLYFTLVFGIILQIAVLSFVHPVIRHCIPFLLVGIIFVCGECLQRMSWQRLIPLIGICLLYSFFTIANTPTASKEVRLQTLKSMNFMQEKIGDGDCVATNVPFELSWRTNCQAMWLPVTLKDYQKLERRYNCRYFYYHSRKQNDWINTSPQLKEYLNSNYRCIYQYAKGNLQIYLFRKK